MKALGENIKNLRIENKMSQTEFAKRINVAKSSASSYESGDRLPSYDILIKIAALFRVTVDNLLGQSSNYNVDVTGLTPLQRNTINDIIKAFLVVNQTQNQINKD